jgi:hypothetical protein
LGFPGEKTSALNGNHLEIAEFSSKEDDNYVRVASHIIDIVKAVTENDRMYLRNEKPFNIRISSKHVLDDMKRREECNHYSVNETDTSCIDEKNQNIAN